MPVKAGVKTSEFWVSIAALLLPVVLPIVDHAANAPFSWQSVLAAAVAGAGYAISRGLAKKQP